MTRQMKIKDLQERYNISSRQTLYNRLKAAEVDLAIGEGREKQATPEQVELLDQLERHLQNGGSLKNFTPVSLAVVEPVSAPVQGALDTVQSPQDTSLMLQFVEALQTVVQPQDPLWFHERLEKAAEGSWQLTTREVRELIGVKPKGKEYRRGCWLFRKVGRIGNQSAWTVEKIS